MFKGDETIVIIDAELFCLGINKQTSRALGNRKVFRPPK